MDKEKLWTKMFVSTSIVHFSLFLSMYLLIVTMASYAINVYDANTGMAGLVSSIFIIGVLLGRLYGGNKIEIIGKKKLLLIGNTVYVIMAFFYFLPLDIYTLMFIRILQGVGTGLATTATATIVSQIIPDSRKGEGIGYFSISVILSAAIGPLIGVFLINQFNFESIFIFSLVVGVIAIFLSNTIEEPSFEKVEITLDFKNKKNNTFRFSNYFESNAIPISMIVLIVAFSYSGLLSFVTTYSSEIQIVEAGGYYFLVYAFAVLLTRPFSGKLFDLKGTNSVVYPSLIFFTIGMLVISQATTSFIFLLGAVFIGIGYGNFQSSTQALAIKVTPIERIGLANSTYFIFLDLALGIGPLIIGVFIPIIGFRGLYLCLSIIILLGLTIYYFMHGRRDRKILGLVNKGEFNSLYK